MDGFVVKCKSCGKEIEINKQTANKHLHSFGWPNKQIWIDDAIKKGEISIIGREDESIIVACVCGNKICEP